MQFTVNDEDSKPIEIDDDEDEEEEKDQVFSLNLNERVERNSLFDRNLP